MNLIRSALGWLLTLFGGTLTIVGVSQVLKGGGHNGRGIDAAVTFLFAGVTYAGVKLLRRPSLPAAPAPPAALPGPSREQLALKAAQSHAGLVGAAQLAASIGMSFADAHETLEGLLKQGACEVVVTEGGAVLYRFPDLVAMASSEPMKLIE